MGVVAPAGAAPAPGVTRGSGKKEGHSPSSKPGWSPTAYQLRKSDEPYSIVSNVVSRHSPAAVRHALEGSRCVLLTMGLPSRLDQRTSSGSEAFAGTATLRFAPVQFGHEPFRTQMPG